MVLREKIFHAVSLIEMTCFAVGDSDALVSIYPRRIPPVQASRATRRG